MSDHDPRDLIVIALSGVQRYITESQTTADLRAASQIVAHLASEAVDYLTKDHGAEMVFPSTGVQGGEEAKDGIPNRVVALIPAGQGAIAAKATKQLLENTWGEWVEEVFCEALETPGWPVIQWVSVPLGSRTYAQAWELAQRSLAERKNIRDFSQPGHVSEELCMLSPRWRAVNKENVPSRAPEHWKGEQLAVANWVKRLWGRDADGDQRFPSTNAIASLPYRRAVLTLWENVPGVPELVQRLHDAAMTEPLDSDPIKETRTPGLPEQPSGKVPRWLRRRGSRWIYPETWHVDALARECTDSLDEADVLKADPSFIRTVRSGERAARELMELMVAEGVAPPSPHLAVLAHDVDSIGKYLSGMGEGQDGTRLDLSRGHEEHSKVSARLARTATLQRAAVEDAGGVVIYAGGDDLLALVPAESALEAARACREAGEPGLPHASDGLLFFHHGSSLQRALNSAHELLKEAKEVDGKNGLGVGYIRSSGSNAKCVLPWTERALEDAPSAQSSPVDSLELFVPSASHPRARLSPRLLSDLLAQRNHLDGGPESATQDQYEVLPYHVARAVMKKLVLRHTSLTPGVGGTNEHSAQSDKAEKEAFAEQATESLIRMAPEQKLIDENAVRVALFLRQEAR
ncbi:type III-B CRISPR-associated protein Cas10/Cmr2 [Nocardiopsis alba]|uniref:type III-B CRISPR-associated protein Cas10/Cmr2 n=1 Tax=Nocardiopsis alba TaxID=53437 RepID=UPI0035DC2401